MNVAGCADDMSDQAPPAGSTTTTFNADDGSYIEFISFTNLFLDSAQGNSGRTVYVALRTPEVHYVKNLLDVITLYY